MSGRRRAQVAEDARLLGQPSFIYEAGCVLELDGEELWLTELVDGERTVHEQIEDRARPRCCSITTPAGSSTTIHGTSEPRDLASVPRAGRRRRGRRAAARARARRICGSSTTASCAGARPTLAHLGDLRGYHLIPAGGSKAAAVARHMRARGLRARGHVRGRRLARGPRGRRASSARFWLVANGSRATRRWREAIRAHANVRVAERATARASTRRSSRRWRSAAERGARRAAARAARAGAARSRASAASAPRGGTVVRTSATQSASGSSPSIRRERPPVTGALKPARSIERASSGTDSSASTACATRSWISAGGTPCGEQLAGAAVAAHRRERGRDEVAGAGEADERLRPRARGLGETPDLGEDVSGRGARRR